MSRPALLLLALVLALASSPAAAAPVPGGTANSDPQGSKSADVRGPIVPGPRWVVEVPDYNAPSGALVLDDAGQLLFLSRHQPTGEASLVALDTADGALAWEARGVDLDCTPVASDDGRVFVQASRDSTLLGGDNDAGAVMALDSADGTADATYVPDEADPELPVCGYGLVLSPDDILLVAAKEGTINDPWVMQAFDVSGDEIDPLWRIERDAVGVESVIEVPVLSPDGDAVWIGHQDEEDDLVVEVLDITDGSSAGTVEVPGEDFGSGGDGTNNRYSAVAVGTGLIVQTNNDDGSDQLLRIGPEDGALALTWEVELAGHDQIDGALSSIAVADDSIFAIAGARQVVRLDAADGTVQFVTDYGTDIRGGEPIAVDAAGNTYIGPTNDSALASLNPLGGIRYRSATPQELLGEEADGRLRQLGPIGPDGTLYIGTQGDDTPPQPVIAAIENGDARLEGEDVVANAISLCQYLFGDDEARAVVLARNDVFADTLSGAPLAGDDSCILFTDGGPEATLRPETLTEIDRALPPGAPVYVMGGEVALGPAVAEELVDEGYAVDRLFGATRIQTATAVADRLVELYGPADEAVLAFAGNWPDATTGGAWAAATRAPVLLTGTDDLHPDTDAKLVELGIQRTWVLGGAAVVSDAAAAAAPDAQRVAGDNRMATAADVAGTLWDTVPGGNPAPGYVLVNLETELGWALSLAASPLSVRLTAPQLGVRATSVPEETRAFLAAAGFDIAPGIVAIGDLGTIAEEVVEDIEAELTGAG